MNKINWEDFQNKLIEVKKRPFIKESIFILHSSYRKRLVKLLQMIVHPDVIIDSKQLLSNDFKIFGCRVIFTKSVPKDYFECAGIPLKVDL